ncbi:MAG: SGNH/GDSL hydrolase family protein [bacterium]
MKVLILGNSQDTGTFVAEEAKRQYRIREQLAAEFGEPVEIAVRNVWPSERMVNYVMRSVDEERPDLVYVNVTNYPYAYESLPLRVQRIFGKAGKPVGDAGMKLADSRRWSHNAAFRALRRFGQATIGGDTHFTPEQVIERYSELIRTLLRHEGTAVAVKGPMGKSRAATGRQRARAEAKRAKVHGALKSLCLQLHVYYAGSDTPAYVTSPPRKGTSVGDGLHSNAIGHQISAEDHFPLIRDAWREHVALSSPASAERARGS